MIKQQQTLIWRWYNGSVRREIQRLNNLNHGLSKFIGCEEELLKVQTFKFGEKQGVEIFFQHKQY